MIAKKNNKPILILSNDYRNFIKSMKEVFAFQNRRNVSINTEVSVIIDIFPGKNRRKGDLDAYNKQILDALEGSGIIENDNQVQDLLVFMNGKNASKDDVIKISLYY